MESQFKLNKNECEKFIKKIFADFFNKIEKDPGKSNEFFKEWDEHLNFSLKQIKINEKLEKAFNLIFKGIKEYHEDYLNESNPPYLLNKNKKRKKNIRFFFFVKIKKVLLSLNKDSSKKDIEEDVLNSYYFWLSLCVLYNISEINIELREINDMVKESYEDEKKNIIRKSRNYFLDSLLKNIEVFILILSKSLDLKIGFNEDISEFFGHMLLFLEIKNFIKSTKKKISIDGSVFFCVTYNINCFDLNENDALDLSNIFLFKIKKSQIYKNEVLFFRNKNYDSNNFKMKSYISVSPSLMGMQSLIKKNKRYGFFINNKKNNNIEEFIDEDSSFIKFAFKKKSEKMMLNLDIFFDVFDFIRKKSGLSQYIKPTTNPDEIYNLLNNYKDIESSDNKNRLQNILILLELMSMYSVFIEKGYFYLSFFFDFRSRMYYNSMAGLTTFKLSRFFLTSNDYREEDLKKIIENTKYASYYKLYLNLYDLYENKIPDIIKNNFKNSNSSEDYKNYEKTIIINSLLSLGAINKSKILNSKLTYKITINEFIEEALHQINIFGEKKESYFNNIKDIEDFFKIKSIFNFLFKEKDLKKKFYIGLDFSASGHQIRYLLNNFENLDYYDLININSEDNSWCDIYTYLIKEFEKKFNLILKNDTDSIKEIKDKFKKKDIEKILIYIKKESNINFINSLFEKTFKRSLLKKSIMTTEYNVSFFQFINYYKDSLKKNDIDILNELDKEKKIIFDFIFFYFYDFCKNINNHSKINFKKSNKEIEEMLKNFCDYKVKHSDGFIAALACFKESSLDLRTEFVDEGKKRYTISHQSYTNEIDNEKTQNSLMPNFIHSWDGVLLRFILRCKWWSDSPYFTIHDEYWLPIQEKLLILDHINFIIKLDLAFDQKEKKDVLNNFNAKTVIKKEDFEKNFKKLFNLVDKRIKNFKSPFIIL